MPCVREERQGFDGKTDDHFDDDKQEVENNADDKGLVDIFEVNGMVMVAKAKAVVMIMVVTVCVVMSISRVRS